MVITPKTRGFICTTSHPAGCRKNVENQINYVKNNKKPAPYKKVLVIGASMGYGLAARISAAYNCDAATIGIIFDKPGTQTRTGSAGWYNSAAFEEFAHADGLYAKTINGDAFSEEIKQQTIDMIKKDLGKIDLVVYSLAAPKRKTADGTVYSSVLKTTESSYTNKTIDLKNNSVTDITIEPATEKEIHDTVKVMGGEDWKDWITKLKASDVLEENALTVAFSYIGPELTHPMYMNGSIGKAKEHLYMTADEIRSEADGVRAFVSVNKALVTQSSAAIPIVPLYISILYKIMKKHSVHEGCIQQMLRLFTDRINENILTDEENLIRLDDLEMQDQIQKEVMDIWQTVNNENVMENADIKGYWDDFFAMFGFGLDGVDYEADISPVYNIESIAE